jgi:UDP-glucose 4-epimerase
MDVVSAVESVSSSAIPIREVERREGDVGICVAMPKRAEMELNWKTERTLYTCCKDIWNFLGKIKSDEVPAV